MMEIEHVFADADDSDFLSMSFEPRILEPPLPSPRETLEHHRSEWGTLPQVESSANFKTRDYANVEGEGHSVADPETLEKVWSWTVNVCIRVWDKLEPVVVDYLPEDRNPFWVCGVLVLVLFLAIAGLRAGAKQGPAVNAAKVEAVKVDNLPPINVPHVKLPDGRRVAYREQGISQELARHTILVVHGFPSSRLAGIPGIKTRLLEEFGVRLIAYDRPGFGESDLVFRKNLRSSAQDMAQIADSLGVEEKFWVVGFSTGGIHAWAAMKYIPDRLAGVSLLAPGGNFYAPNMTKQESSEIWRAVNFKRKLLFRIARWAPSFLPFFCRRMVLENIDKLQNDYLVTVGKDNVLMQQDMFVKALMRDVEESLQQGNAAIIAQEFLIQVRPWGFHLSDFRMRKKLPNSGLLNRLRNFWKEEERGWEGFNAPIHIWHGTDDQIVPLGINEFAGRMVPQAVLHRLDGEGHFSYFWFCDKCHRNIFLTMFKEPEGVKSFTTEHPGSVGLETLYQAYEQTRKA